jgi:hypothetical protein
VLTLSGTPTVSSGEYCSAACQNPAHLKAGSRYFSSESRIDASDPAGTSGKTAHDRRCYLLNMVVADHFS